MKQNVVLGKIMSWAQIDLVLCLFPPLLAHWLWTCYLPSLTFKFFMWKMGY